MNVLFIGGTGLISSACSELALQRGIELVILNRGRSTRYPAPAGARLAVADRHDQAAMDALLAGQRFDAVVDWIAYEPEEIERESVTGRATLYVVLTRATQRMVTVSTPR